MPDLLPISIEEQIQEVEREIALRLEPPAAYALLGGLTLLIDQRDSWIFKESRWSIRPHRNTLYLWRRQQGETVHLHRQITGADEVEEVDHRNGNGLDNRRCNLRFATRAQNSCNQAGRLQSKHGFIGVDSWHGYWRARLKVNYREVHCSYHATQEEAARARDEAAIRFHGEFACLNFPRSSDDADRSLLRLQAVLATLQESEKVRQSSLREAAAIVEDEAMPSERARFGVAADRIRDRATTGPGTE